MDMHNLRCTAYQGRLLEYERTMLSTAPGSYHPVPPTFEYCSRLGEEACKRELTRIDHFFRQQAGVEFPPRDILKELTDLRWDAHATALFQAQLLRYEFQLRYINSGEGFWLPDPPARWPAELSPAIARREIGSILQSVAIPLSAHLRVVLPSPRNQAHEFQLLLRNSFGPLGTYFAGHFSDSSELPQLPAHIVTACALDSSSEVPQVFLYADGRWAPMSVAYTLEEFSL